MPEAIEIVPEFGDVRDEEQLDWAKLAAFLRDKIPGADAPMTVKQFRGGSSNLTYLLRFGDREWVMRRPPFGPLPVGGHDMGREYKVLSQLWEVFKPAPRGMLFSDDFPLARMWRDSRALRIADGPDEVHRMTIARRELRKYK